MGHYSYRDKKVVGVFVRFRCAASTMDDFSNNNPLHCRIDHQIAMETATQLEYWDRILIVL
jgi:hypothetical protein